MTEDLTAFLIGRHYVTKSGNTGRIVRLDNSAIRIVYKHKPTPDEIEEFNNWVASLIGNCEVTACTDINKEQEMLKEWKKKTT